MEERGTEIFFLSPSENEGRINERERNPSVEQCFVFLDTFMYTNTDDGL